MAQLIGNNQVKLSNGQVVTAQNGGWYDAQRLWNGALGAPGFNPETGQQVSTQVNQQSDVAQAKPVGTIDAYIASLQGKGTAGGAGTGGSAYGSALESIKSGLTPDQSAYASAQQGIMGAFANAASGARAQEPLVRQAYADLAAELEQQQKTEEATANRIGTTNIGKATAYLANQGLQQAGGSLAEPIATAQADLQDKIGEIGTKYSLSQKQIVSQMNKDIADLEAKAADYELKGAQTQADAIKDIINLKQQQEQIDIQRQNAARAGSSSPSARKDALIADIKAKKTLTEVLANYQDVIDKAQILDLYNLYSPYGKAKETPEQLQKLGLVAYTDTDIADYANSVISGDATLTNVPAAIRSKVGALVTQANQASANK